MIYVTGDTHGNQAEWAEHIERILSAGDTLIVCGDFGVGFWNGRCRSEETFYDHISEQDFAVLFVDGNHENFVKLSAYPVEEWNGGRVHRLRHNLIHLMRGEIYRIEGKTFFTFGGGYSLDKYRRVENISWWPQEMPSDEEYRNGEEKLLSAGNHVDYIITHTAPAETVYYLSALRRLGISNALTEERPLTLFLDRVQKGTAYSHWYFGHFHVDMELWRNQSALMNSVRELESGKTVEQWGLLI